MTQTLGAYYQCHKNPTSFLRCIKSFKRYYPDSSIVVTNDGGYDYSEFCSKNNIQYTYCTKAPNIRNATTFDTKSSILIFINKIWSSLHLIKETHFIILEDDVRILKHHTQPFKYTLNGCNTGEFLPECMQTILKNNGYTGKFFFGGCGGTIFSKSFLEDIPFTHIITLVDSLPDIFQIGSDMVLTFIVLYFGGRVGSHPEFGEMWYPNIQDLLKKNLLFSVHQYKTDYDTLGEKMTDDERLGFRFKL